MKKILLIISREYLTRVRKTSFWVLTIIVPILIALLYAIPIYLATKPAEKAIVLVVDETDLFQGNFQSSEDVSYRDAGGLDYAKRTLSNNDSIKAIVFIPARETTIPNDAFIYYHSTSPALNVQNDIDHQLQEILRSNILLDVHNISTEDYDLISNTKIKIRTQDLATGRDAFLSVKTLIGCLLAVLIYIVIVLFGSQVMMGVMEEKSNRIVEIIICSVKPFQLMMGKVVGIALVGITQLALWFVIGAISITGIQMSNAELFERAQKQHALSEIATKGSDATLQHDAAMQEIPIPEIVEGLTSINFGTIILAFACFFILGYLLYATLYAMVGSISDSDNDSQQFTIPITFLLLLSLILLPAMINEPGGRIATWLSIIPFTSPIAMMVRIPFGVPLWQVRLSIGLLIVAFIFCTWIAAKIYRRGILHHGNKVSYKDLWLWIRGRR